MTQEDKKLLLKDLCGRLPYGVRFPMKIWDDKEGKIVEKIAELDIYNESGYAVGTIINGPRQEYVGEIVKPYLFPLSNMTEEQKKEISKRYNFHTSYGLCIEITNHSEGYWDDDNSCHLQDYLWLVDWFNKNHFDYRGLIPKGLAIDATRLNVY